MSLSTDKISTSSVKVAIVVLQLQVIRISEVHHLHILIDPTTARSID